LKVPRGNARISRAASASSFTCRDAERRLKLNPTIIALRMI
jgi:hypothetical protein